MSSYCLASRAHHLLQHHHDHEHGFPVQDDDRLFEYLLLEINQAGLSWLTVVKKRAALKKAYADFSFSRVARFGVEDILRLMQDASIIRHRLKIEAAIFNAQRICEIAKTHGSFKAWLDGHHPLERAAWVKLFRRTFRFVGNEIVGEFLMGTGYLPDAHARSCPVYARVLASRPPWTHNEKQHRSFVQDKHDEASTARQIR